MNGVFTENAAGNKMFQKEERQDYLHCETYSDTGSPKRKDRIVYIENSHKQIKPFIVKEVNDEQEVIQHIYELIPELSIEAIGLKIYTTRMGSFPRTLLSGFLPESAEVLYITLYLRKHPRINLNAQK